jgi:hypothetical protein
MSPPADDATIARTPDRRSSAAALFTAFRNLTGGRTRTPPDPQTPRENSPRFVGDQNGVQPVVGGPPQLNALVVRLDSRNPLPERAAAIDEICAILKDHPVRNVLGLWNVASDLILPEQPDEAADMGYRLLMSCVSWPRLSTIERSAFFDVAALLKSDDHFNQRLDVINVLTKRGRNIEACEPAIVPFILAALDVCYTPSSVPGTSRKAQGKRRADRSPHETEDLARLLQYAADICKFNAKILTDDDLKLLLGRAVGICRDTRTHSDMENCIKLLEAVITYVHVPQQAIRPCVEVLCTIYGVMDDKKELRDQSWNTLRNMFQSHIGGVAVLSLLHTLLDGPSHPPDKRPRNMYRGTYQVLHILLLDDGNSGLPAVPISLLCPALKASIHHPSSSQEVFVVTLLGTMLSKSSLRDQLLGQAELGELLDIICLCAEREDDRHRGTALDSTNTSTTGLNKANDSNVSPRNLGSPSNGRDRCHFTTLLCLQTQVQRLWVRLSRHLSMLIMNQDTDQRHRNSLLIGQIPPVGTRTTQYSRS